MSKQKLLLADDSITIQKVVNLTFADEGIEVISVGDGNSAMEKFVESTPDLVMVDVNMPGLDGYRICEMIKQDEETKHVPVILLVGSFEPFDEDEARRVGANDYLTKPFQSIRQLVNKVSVLLSKSNGNESSVQTPEIIPEPRLEAQEATELPVQISETVSEYKPKAELVEQVQEGQFVVPNESERAPEVEVHDAAKPIEEAFGDAGMDDEMIQASQIGSLPVDEYRKFKTGETELNDEAFENTPDEYSADQVVDSEFDHWKTKPFTADELEEISTSTPQDVDFEATEKIFPNENQADEERAISLENQMVSEFETENNESVPEFETRVREIPVDEYFARDQSGSKDVSANDKPESYEQPTESISHIGELDDEAVIVSQDSTIESEPIERTSDAWEIYESPETSDVPEPEEPYHYVEYMTADEKATVLPELDFEETESADATDSGTSFEDRKEINPNPESEFHQAKVNESPIETVISEELPVQSFEQIAQQPAYLDEDLSADPQNELVETETDIFKAVENNFDGAETIPEFQTSIYEERVNTTAEIPLPIPTIEEEVSPIQEIPPTEFKSAEATTHSPVSAMVSTKDTSDAVESVIVSEFARHSISLSSEAVETIAARIAEKISEKIVQQLATDVVANLADLIVDRMEQRKLK